MERCLTPALPAEQWGMGGVSLGLDYVPAVEKSWAGYIELFGQAFGAEARRAEERRWHIALAQGDPVLLEHKLGRAATAIEASVRRLRYREEQEQWREGQRRRARGALKIRLRDNEGADATTGRNYKIWRRYREGRHPKGGGKWFNGPVTYAQLAQEFGISVGRVGAIVTRQRELAPLRQEIWAEGRQNLGRPVDLDLNQEDYRGKWLEQS